ncbi:MAG TPA: hypothetical protein DIT64_01860 [Verrucomicrobiales bacterium]|nr:hypothetical protein [Verrucomicrobiales bacterium]
MPAVAIKLNAPSVHTPPKPPRITEAEYEAILAKSEDKLEFRDGRIIAMAGGGASHCLVKGNLLRQFSNALAGRGCRVFDSDMKVKVEATGLNTFPDLSIVCLKPRLTANGLTLLNPGLIAEALSPGTEGYDRGEKFWHYRHLPELRCYVLVSTAQALVEVYERQTDESWRLTSFDGWQAVVRLEEMRVEIPLSGIYALTALDPEHPLDETAAGADEEAPQA